MIVILSVFLQVVNDGEFVAFFQNYDLMFVVVMVAVALVIIAAPFFLALLNLGACNIAAPYHRMEGALGVTPWLASS